MFNKTGNGSSNLFLASESDSPTSSLDNFHLDECSEIQLQQKRNIPHPENFRSDKSFGAESVYLQQQQRIDFSNISNTISYCNSEIINLQ